MASGFLCLGTTIQPVKGFNKPAIRLNHPSYLFAELFNSWVACMYKVCNGTPCFHSLVYPYIGHNITSLRPWRLQETFHKQHAEVHANLGHLHIRYLFISVNEHDSNSSVWYIVTENHCSRQHALSTHRGWVVLICINRLNHLRIRLWLVNSLRPSDAYMRR